MTIIQNAVDQLRTAFDYDEPVTLSAEQARVLHNLLSAEPQVLAVDIADAALEAAHVARECFWLDTLSQDHYWDVHRRLVRELRVLLDLGWLEVKSRDE